MKHFLLLCLLSAASCRREGSGYFSDDSDDFTYEGSGVNGDGVDEDLLILIPILTRLVILGLGLGLICLVNSFNKKN